MDIPDSILKEIGGLEDALEQECENWVKDIINATKKYVNSIMLPLAFPKFGRKALTDIEWLAMARGESDNFRPYLAYIHVKNGIAESTNGHILFWVPTNKPDGFYDKDGNQTEADALVKYPDTSKIRDINHGDFFEIEIKKEDVGHVMLNNCATVNADLLALGFNGESPDQYLISYAADVSKPILFKHKTLSRKFAIMPMRVDWRNDRITL